jgi:hypothetical protein
LNPTKAATGGYASERAELRKDAAMSDILRNLEKMRAGSDK